MVSIGAREHTIEQAIEFVEAFAANYADGMWINKGRQRLIEAIDRASGQE